MSTLGPFEIGRVLGTGGSGTVYAARAPSSGEEIALKVLREDAAVTSGERARFMDEAARMRRVSHPALVSVLDAGFLPDGRPYVAMPLLHGESLASRIARGRIPLPEALPIWMDLAGALTAIHAAGLVHRDIKPENVMVTAREGRSAGTLLDLGIARDVDAPASTTTKLGNIRGTPAYMALERFFGTPASVSSDVYELTVTLYMMLTGALPWQKPEDATERITPKAPSDLGVALPDALAQAIMKGLAAKPDARWASAAELSAAVLAAAPPHSSPHAFESTSVAQVQPFPADLGSAPTAIQAGSIAPPHGSIAPPPQAAPESASRSNAMPLAVFGGLLLVGAMVAGAVVLTRARDLPTPTPTSTSTSTSTSTPTPTPTSTSTSTSTPTSTPTSTSTSTSIPFAPQPRASKPAAAPDGPDDLAFCKELLGVYCSGDSLRTGGQPACRQYTATLAEMRTLGPNARKKKNDACGVIIPSEKAELARRKAQMNVP